jgi:probable F420-dependent oxidoreductase
MGNEMSASPSTGAQPKRTIFTTSARPMKIGVIVGLGEGEMGERTPRYRDIENMAHAAEQSGFDSFWVADHLLFRMPDQPELGTWEAFTFLSALAATTSRIVLGPLVACTSFRNPALLAKMADSLDEISNGRFILGLGAGWHQPEYTAFGYPFDHLASRFEEALKILVPLLREGEVDFAGQYYTARDCFLRPRGPTPSGPPIWIGAKQPRMLQLSAQYADGFNTVWHRTPDKAAPRLEDFRQACAERGRDVATVELSVGTLAHILAPGESSKEDAQGLVGEAEAVAEGLAAFAALGTQHLIVIISPEDIRGIERFGKVIELLDQRLQPR